MKKMILTVIAACLLAGMSYMAGACTKSSAQVKNTQPDTTGSDPHYSAPIPVAQANEMIQSYLDAIDYTHNTNKIKSFVINADSLRAYLSDTTIKYMKLFLAHTPAWIAAGNRGKLPGPDETALTIVIAGMGADYNYIFEHAARGTQTYMVMDKADPCPDDCHGTDIIN